ncbi:MAG: multicopper oxidase family protein [Neisseriales bacterium]|nr:MAG: multicopper oxidase family protein [Neisseriales bacterium]
MKLKNLIIFTLFTSIAFANPVILEVKQKTISVNGKSVKVSTIEQPDGTWGYWGKLGESFDVIVKNKLAESTMIHWHGLILPNNQDGVAGVTNPEINPGKEFHFNFPLQQSGSYWMHSHDGMQLQDMIAAPLIIETPEDAKYQQVVVMFQDYSSKSANQVLKGLQANNSDAMGHMNHDMHGMKMDGMDMGDMDDMQDINDVKYDAYLTNYHDNLKPQITQVKPGASVKLRFINSASASNFWINLGKLKGTLVAVDGSPVKPITGSKFQLAMGQRSDIIVDIPKVAGDFPILGQVEGIKSQTGLILTSKSKSSVTKIANNANSAAPALNYNEELQLHSSEPIAFGKVDHTYKIKLTGDMNKYTWQMNGETWPNITPPKVNYGDTVTFEFDNQTMMSHPMHLHGYNFKVVSINGKKIDGALRDTILVMPHSKVTVEFKAEHKGKWMLHCHTLYHMHAGMMTYINVE